MSNISKVFNIDCMEFMKICKDKEFDLAIVDPPYGININHNMGRRKSDKKSNYRKINWDNEIPKKEYFAELFRVSKNQIIWGGNYFLEYLDSTPCFLIWDKQFSEYLSFAQFEMAWTSFKISSKKFEFHPSNIKNKIHPTQKPVALYKWMISKFAKPGDKLIDTHLGSGSNRIAAYDLGFDFWGCELDKYYFDLQEKRFKEHCMQGNLFEMRGGKLI